MNDQERVMPRVFIAKIDGSTWHEQYLKHDKTWTDYIDGRHSDSAGDFDATELPADAAILIAYEVPGSTRYARVNPGVLRPVSLTQTGGSDGTQSSACSYTYTVADAITGEQMATGVSPEHNRPYGKTVAATCGLAWMANGTCHLVSTDEIPNKRACV